MKTRFIESRTVHLLLLAAGGLLLITALVQLPVTLFVQYSRPSIPWFPVEYVPEGIRIVPVISRENQPLDPQFEMSDILTQVNGMRLDSAHFDDMSWQDKLASLRIGDTLNIRYLRSGEMRNMDLVLEKSISDVRGKGVSLISLIVHSISPVIMILIGYLVLLRRPRRRGSVLFFGTLFMYAFYLLSAVQASMHMPWWTMMGEVKIVLIEISFMLFLPMLLHFLLVFPDEWFMHNRPRLRLLLVYAPYVLLTTVGYLLLNVLELQVTRAYSNVADLIFIATPILCVLVVRTSYRRAAAPKTRRFMRITLAGILAFTVGFVVIVLINHLYLFYDFLLPATIEIRLVALLLITFSLPVSIGYALLRYGFLDIQIMFKRTTLYAVLSAIVIVMFILLYSILHSLFDSFTKSDVLIVSIIVTGVLAIFIGIGKQGIQKAIDQRFFGTEWERSERMRRLSRSLLHMLNYDDLLSTLTGPLPDALDVEFASVQRLREDGSIRLLAGGTVPEDVGVHLAAQPGLFERLTDGRVIDTNTLPVGSGFHALSAIFSMSSQDGEHVCLMLGNRRSGRALSGEEFTELQSLAEHAILGWKNASISEELREQERMKHEVQLAQNIQAAMLPHETPRSPVFDVAAFSVPAREVGGDFYDYLRLPDGRMMLVVGDVSDKGVSAAMVRASAISTLRFAAEHEDSPRRILEAANRRLFNDTFRQMFAAVCLAVLDEGALTMSFTNAGLPKPLLLRDGEAFLIEWSDNGMHYPLGMVEDTVYHEETMELQSGDLLLLYSDGVTESANARGEEFGVRRLRDCLLACSADSAMDLMMQITSTVQEFRGSTELFDDLTMMVVRVK